MKLYSSPAALANLSQAQDTQDHQQYKCRTRIMGSDNQPQDEQNQKPYISRCEIVNFSV